MKAKEISSNNKSMAFFLVTIAITLFSSCSKLVEELIPEEPKVENILVEESPWVFSLYQNTLIEDDGGSGLSEQEITDDMSDYLVGVGFTFNADGTGFIDIPEQGQEDWVWMVSNDRLTTTSSSQTDVYTFFTADRNQMTFESRTSTLHTRDSVQYTVTHVGTYFFK